MVGEGSILILRMTIAEMTTVVGAIDGIRMHFHVRNRKGKLIKSVTIRNGSYIETAMEASLIAHRRGAEEATLEVAVRVQALNATVIIQLLLSAQEIIREISGLTLIGLLKAQKIIEVTVEEAVDFLKRAI